MSTDNPHQSGDRLEPGKPEILVRPLVAADEAQWRILWQGFLDFYNASVETAISDETWARILAHQHLLGLGAEYQGQLIGFAHVVLHLATWSATDTAYLEDLFVSPEHRGCGAGRALIDELIRLAGERGYANVYWHTHVDNRAARSLYDDYVLADDFVRYRLQPASWKQG